MGDDIPIERYADALRAFLARYPPAEGFHLIEVRVDGGAVAVAFQWQRDPHTFLIRFGQSFLGPFVAEPEVPDAAIIEGWCEDVQFWLMEELDTGHMARATRHCEEDLIVLTEPAQRTQLGDVWVSDVPQFSADVPVPWRIRLRVAPRLMLARLRGRPAIRLDRLRAA